jgi:pantothenate kinase
MKIAVNGLEQEIFYDRHGIEDLLAPLLREWIAQTRGAGRHYAFLAAPPGTGKSTIATLLERAVGGELQCLGIDGFHYPQEVLRARSIRTDDGREIPLASIKGAPETFDVAGLERLLTRSYTEDVRWPSYDRRLHDVVEGSDLVTAHHVLLEGNWLLLDEEPWSGLRRHAERTIFIEAPSDLLQERLVSRKVAGGLSRADAEAFYLRSDGPNVERTLSGSDLDSVDLLLTMDVNGSLHERKTS